MSVLFLGRVVGSSRRVPQSNHVPGYLIAGHKAKRWPGAGEERLAATKHDGVEVDPILIDKTKLAQALRQVWSANGKFPNTPSLQPAYQRLDVIGDKSGVGAD